MKDKMQHAIAELRQAVQEHDRRHPSAPSTEDWATLSDHAHDDR